MTIHRQVHIAWPERGIAADVDEDIAELVLTCWQVGVHTLTSCQEYPSTDVVRRVQLGFYPRSAEHFLSIAAGAPDEVEGSLYMRVLEGAGDPRRWTVDFSAGDHAPEGAARADIRVRVFVVFPFDDVEEVRRRLLQGPRLT